MKIVSNFISETIDEDIEHLEQNYSFKFPPDYKEFLRKYNGGKTYGRKVTKEDHTDYWETTFDLNGIKISIIRFYGFVTSQTSEGYPSIAGHLRYNRPEEMIEEQGVLHIASADFDDYIVMGIDHENYSRIYYIYHDGDGELIPLASTFKEFISHCISETSGDDTQTEVTIEADSSAPPLTKLNSNNTISKLSKRYCGQEGGDDTVGSISRQILRDPELANLNAITLGVWDQYLWNPKPFFTMIINNKSRFQHIESLFIGDYDLGKLDADLLSNLQGNYEELLNALPNLKTLVIQGTDDLELGTVDHKNLEKLEIRCIGLPVSVLNEIKAANLPNLKELNIYLGMEDYGCDCELSDFAELIQKERFPNLTRLGFLNSELADELVNVILGSDMVNQLEVIDLSFGCLTDLGGQTILDFADTFTALKKMNINYHFLSDDMMKQLSTLPFEVDTDNRQEYDEDYFYPMYTG